ncbi:MAG TPA: universal stress protein [Roseiflexaceae bacterium]|nr:universal stress protein [Roseiflexaceae bacterium]HMP42639.1 universal stress protein [Roseiflexaceae bacterium]
MYRTLMVPLDGSAVGECALPLAMAIAQRADALIDLVHVCTPPAAHDLLLRFRQEDEDISPQASSRLYLNQLADRLAAAAQVAITTTVLDGEVAATLRSHAIATGTDLVVMTTRGRGSLARATLGSVADELIRTMSLPLLLTHPVAYDTDQALPVIAPGRRKILVPLDGSVLAEMVLETAVSIGSLFDAEYTLLQVIDPPMLGYALTARAVQLDEQAVDIWRGEVLTYLDAVADRLRGRGLSVTTDVAFGYPPHAILMYANMHAADLIVMATHGRSGMARILLGSTAGTIIREAHIPVLVKRPAT